MFWLRLIDCCGCLVVYFDTFVTLLADGCLWFVVSGWVGVALDTFLMC